MGQTENFKNHTLHHLQACLVCPELALLIPWAQETAGIIPECSSHTSSSLRRRGPSPPVWHLGHEEEMSKGSIGLSQLGERTPVSSWELELDPT